jgi:hypothetical protein
MFLTDIGPLRLLDVKVVRSALDRSQYEWRVFERDGTFLQSSTQTYATERDALRDGNAAARAIRKAGSWCPHPSRSISPAQSS